MEVEYIKIIVCVNICIISCKFCLVIYCIIKYIVYSEIFLAVILKDRVNLKRFFNNCVNKKEY